MRKVMLIEDEEFILQGLQNILDWQELGMEVIHAASNGKMALEMWEKEKADIIVTDINMPVMDGLEFLKKLREKESRARCIILTGYDEFDYARKAISLDVEDYILKPIDEEKLECVLKAADSKLTDMDHAQTADIDKKIGWMQLLLGKLEEKKIQEYFSVLPEIPEGQNVYAALMKLNLESIKAVGMSEVMLALQSEEKIKAIYLTAGKLLLLLYGQDKEADCCRLIREIQNRIESQDGVLSFISVGTAFGDYNGLQNSYAEAKKLQKYQVIEGYGSCVSGEQVQHRESQDISIDAELLRRLILKKDQEGAVGYIEDLFINNIRKETSVDDLYKKGIQIAMLLEEIKIEYKLQNHKNMQNLTEMIHQVYYAEDLFTIKTIFIGEITEIIAWLNEEDSQYTPVVKQILAEIRKNYREDMNLKTLSYKYHMNTSYLGQLFQKEVGCSFSRYLSNTKNGIAKDLILNTNMKIHDIAQKVGYPDTSYFYRKFKQSYGVSPASLREMKKY